VRAPLAVADRWFTAETVEDGLTLLWEPHIAEFFVSNVWHVRGRDRDLMVDTANGIGDLRGEVGGLLEGRDVLAVVTHEHFDHMGGLHAFDERLCHPADADGVRAPYAIASFAEDWPEGLAAEIRAYGYEPPERLLTALPPGAFDEAAWRTPPADPTSLLEEGDVLDLGDRAFEVLHVPGHTAGSIALWESSTETLFTGDAFYVDDALMFEDEEAGVRSLRRLRDLPVRIVLGGHGPVVDGDRLRSAIDAELAARGA
jgi:glyoxylase-like metal-dependent hydrolase (beta-lactamase superfamily II)